MQMLLQFYQLFPLALLQSRHRNVRPAGNNFGDVLLSYLFAEKLGPILRRFGGCSGKFLFQLGDSPVLNLACLGQFTTPLRAFELRAKSIKLLLPLSLLFKNCFFLLPFGFERIRLFL